MPSLRPYPGCRACPVVVTGWLPGSVTLEAWTGGVTVEPRLTGDREAGSLSMVPWTGTGSVLTGAGSVLLTGTGSVLRTGTRSVLLTGTGSIPGTGSVAHTGSGEEAARARSMPGVLVVWVPVVSGIIYRSCRGTGTPWEAPGFHPGG